MLSPLAFSLLLSKSTLGDSRQLIFIEGDCRFLGGIFAQCIYSLHVRIRSLPLSDVNLIIVNILCHRDIRV